MTTFSDTICFAQNKALPYEKKWINTLFFKIKRYQPYLKPRKFLENTLNRASSTTSTSNGQVTRNRDPAYLNRAEQGDKKSKEKTQRIVLSERNEHRGYLYLGRARHGRS